MNFRGIFAALGIFNDERTKSNEAPPSNSQPDSPDSQPNDGTPDPIRFIDPITITEDSRLTSKDIYRTYWHCRDFELNHLWQRSVFLTAFIVLCFSAYGMLAGGMLDFIKDENFSEKAHFLRWAHGGAIFLSLIGIVLSCLWIMMAKGSKAWYENYEAAITAYEKNNTYFPISGSDRKIGGFRYANLEGFEKAIEKHKLNECLCCSSGGSYSLSRINWCIGFLSLVVWLLLLVFHASLLGHSLNMYIAILFALLALVMGVSLIYGMSKWKKLRSNSIEATRKKDE